MKIFFTKQEPFLNDHLRFLKTVPAMKYNKESLKEKITTIDLHINIPLAQLDLKFLFDYKIFPASILTYLCEWQSEDRGMSVGDTIVQQVFIPPTQMLSQKIIFGVRINELFDEPYKKGFSYETLEGHVEKGISTFTIEQTGAKLIFKIHTFSFPGNLLSRLAGPVFSTPYQAWCTGQALKNVKCQIENQ